MLRPILLVCLVTIALASGSTITSATPTALTEVGRSGDRSYDSLIAESKSAMLANPSVALETARKAQGDAEKLAGKMQRAVSVATSQWLQGQALLRLNDPHHAAPIITAALQQITRVQPDSKLRGDLLMSRGVAEAAFGRVQEALSDYQKAYELFRKINDRRGQAVSLQTIGYIYIDAGDYPRVLQYYKEASEIYSDDPALSLSSHNNRAFALQHLGKYYEANEEFQRALKSARQMGSTVLEAQILRNIVDSQILGGELNAARASIARGLELTSHGEAASWRPLLLGSAAELALKQDRPQQAVLFLAKAFAGVNIATTTEPYRDVHKTAYQAYQRVGDTAHALQHLEAYKRLDDQTRSLAASTNAALMSARFDFANQDLKIAKLKAGQLQRDVLLSRAKAHQTLIIFGGLLTLAAVVVSLLGLNIRSMRRSRNEIRAANDNLIEVNEALEKALLAKTQFLATTSHEIRTPLNGILGMTEVMLADRGVAPDVRERVSLVHAAGQTMRALVDDILDLAKMETGNLQTNPVEMGLQVLLAETVRFWKDQADAKGLAIALEAPDCPARIIEDEARLRQILFNLMANAIKFTQSGSVTLRASSQDTMDGERLLLAIEDSGLGIPEGAFEDIFEKFKQLDGGTTRRFGGTGLGLSICRNLATAMGGDILVASTLGAGSTFTLSLPLRRAELIAMPEDRAGAVTSLAESNLLLVDANPLVQGMLRTVVEKAVASFSVAADFASAVVATGSGTADVVLIEGTTMHAEGAGGLARLRELAAFAKPCGARIALLWPAPSEADRAELESAGVDCVIAKPIGGTGLLCQLRAIYETCGDTAEETAMPRLKPAA